MAKLFSSNTDTFTSPYGLAYDGHKNLLTVYQLKGIDGKKSREFAIVIKNSEKNIDEEFLIVVQFAAARIDVDIRQVFNRKLQERNSIATLIYDIVLKQRYFFELLLILQHSVTFFDIICSSNYIPFGRRIFYHPLQKIDQFPLGGGAYRFPGFFQSMRPVHGWKIMINVDQANTSFLKGGPVLELLQEIMGRQDYFNNVQIIGPKLLKIVKNLKISQTQRFPHRTAKCTGVSMKSAATQMFSESGSKTSVADYFHRQFQARVFVKDIKYPNLPCLMFGKDKFVPLEFCEVKPDQRYPRKLDGFQTSSMLKMDYLKMNQDRYLQAFGISVSAKMATLDGRVLPAPRIEMGQNKIVSTTLGAWNYTNAPFVQGCRIRNFGVICTTERCRDEEIKLVQKLSLRCYVALVKVHQTVSLLRGGGSNFFRPFFRHFQISLNQRILSLHSNFCMPNESLKRGRSNVYPQRSFDISIAENFNLATFRASETYAKQAGDVAVGVNTQCIQVKNVSMCKFATLNNLNLKINGKLGGINSKLPQDSLKEIKKIDLTREPILYLGADVNHTAPDDNCEPISCAAVVGSVDLNPSVYCARIFLQSQERLVDGQVNRRPQEWISQMENGVLMSIDHFVRRNRILPRRIIMFRDGVGETMFRLRAKSESKKAAPRVGAPRDEKRQGLKTNFRLHFVHVRADASVIGHRPMPPVTLADASALADDKFLAIGSSLPTAWWGFTFTKTKKGKKEEKKSWALGMPEVMIKEMQQIRNACQRVAEKYPQLVKTSGFKIYEPPITFIVVQKRHHTRLFCADSRDSAGERYGFNVPPGTTVDTTIVHPEEFDFYLCSHLGLQGTSKPAHYHVLWDDNYFTADDLQQLIYNICHTYCRSTRSVSIPPPCYYADLVAYRARKYLEVLTSDRSSYHSGASGQSINLPTLQNQVNVKDNIVDRGMFFV
uniref:Uncharacterized protein n=1 Tax=Romanomermis culicivorax TaxID=13658 RepID=A0A915IHH2_ROMCU